MAASIAITAIKPQGESCDNRNGGLLRIPQNAAMDVDWIKQELKRTGKTQAGLAKALTLDPAQVTRLLRGERRLKADEVEKISQFLAAEPPLTATAPATNDSSGFPRDLPIRALAQGEDDGAFEFDEGMAGLAPRPPRLAGAKDAYALYMPDNSMEPWREQGEIIYVHPLIPARPNDFVVVQLKPIRQGEAPPTYIKRLQDRNSREFQFLQYNPKKYMTVPIGKVLSIHRIMSQGELLGS